MGKREQRDLRKSGYRHEGSYRKAEEIKPFAEFRRTVDHELERIILERMKSFRDGIVKLRNRR